MEKATVQYLPKVILRNEWEESLFEAFRQVDAEIRGDRYFQRNPASIDKNYSESSLLIAGGWIRNYFTKRPSTDIDVIACNRCFKMACHIFRHHLLRCANRRKLVIEVQQQNEIIWSRGPLKDKRLVQFVVRFFELQSFGFHLSSKTYTIDISTTDHTLETDFFKRDFTCNALYVDPITHLVIDVSGRAGHDLTTKKVIRCTNFPEETIGNNPIRALRAIRFHLKDELALDDDLKLYLRRKAGDVLYGSVTRTGIQRLCQEYKTALEMRAWTEYFGELLESRLLLFLDYRFYSPAAISVVKRRLAFFDDILKEEIYFKQAVPVAGRKGKRELTWTKSRVNRRALAVVFSLSFYHTAQQFRLTLRKEDPPSSCLLFSMLTNRKSTPLWYQMVSELERGPESPLIKWLQLADLDGKQGLQYPIDWSQADLLDRFYTLRRFCRKSSHYYI